jgi:hypothetical protein
MASDLEGMTDYDQFFLNYKKKAEAIQTRNAEKNRIKQASQRSGFTNEDIEKMHSLSGISHKD